MHESPTGAPAPASIEPAGNRICFGAHELRLDTRQLLSAGQAVSLGTRSFDLLVALIERRGRVVSKRELMSLVWPSTVVEEANLRVCMSAVRKILGPDVIATIPGRGYQFTARVANATAHNAQEVEPGPAPASALQLLGREALFAQLHAAFEEARLLTLIGPAGAGKTSLARELQAGGMHRNGVPRPIYWVELAALADGELLAASIAQACGVTLGDDGGHRDLTAALRSSHALVILDNAEHLVDAVATVAHALLDACSHLRLLVTSQVRLKLSGEVALQVPALEVASAGTPFEEALKTPAQALFMRHCWQAGRSLVADQQTLDLVADICSRLDGLPLAIEYAAAAVPVLGLRGVASSLESRRLSLSANRRDAPQRHRNLRTALSWSVSLLSPLEQLVFRRLGVFAGSCSAELFDAVVNLEGADPWSLMEALSELIDRSLVVAPGDLSPRYRLLETSRSFAMEQLQERNEMTDLRARHALAVERMFTRARAAALAGHIAVDEAIDSMQPDIDNARAALQWALARDDDMALSLSASLAFVLRRAGGDPEARRHLLLTEPLAERCPEAALRSGWLREAIYHWTMTDLSRASRWINVAELGYRELGDEAGLMETLALRAFVLNRAQGDELLINALLDEILRLDGPQFPAQLRVFCAAAVMYCSLRLGRTQDFAWAAGLAGRCSAGDTFGHASLVCALMGTYLTQGQAAQAVELGETLYAQLSQSRFKRAIYWAPISLVRAYLAADRLDCALALASDCFKEDACSDTLHAWVDALAYLACLAGQHECGARMIGYGDAHYQATGGHRLTAQMYFREKAIALAREQMGQAHYAQAHEAGGWWADLDMQRAGLQVIATPRTGADCAATGVSE
ncbi:ATP-binding protein [Roseateles amylovorans]|uniref:Helix-turn-helix transcriptional regulator n=1 Tax=Roseateles amylovorans TaxID=2978473 RepID=A0ABY6B4B7_9BURK|nr:helix-turn-helix transcriptional regulator [Roseateles amylovorans]UXH78378.1 helix-turn-helix transcriptional regulator [Roseateles amylovorans]